MPKRPALRDDDTLGRLHDIERRLDKLEETDDDREKASAKKKRDDAEKG